MRIIYKSIVEPYQARIKFPDMFTRQSHSYWFENQLRLLITLYYFTTLGCIVMISKFLFSKNILVFYVFVQHVKGMNNQVWSFITR